MFKWPGMFAMVLIAGCASTRDPIVVVSDAAAGEKSAEALRLNFTLDLDNPNQQSLRLAELDYRVKIDGRQVFQGTRSAEATLASADHRRMVIPAIIPYEAMGWSADQLPPTVRFSISGKLSYLTSDELSRTFREIGFPPPSAKFSREADVVLTQQ